MPIPALEVPWFPLLLSLSGHDIIKASGSWEVSTLHSQRCSRSSVLSSKEQTQASAFSGLSEVSFRARVCRAICCRHWGCPCRAGTAQGAAGTAPVGSTSPLSCLVWFRSPGQPALAGSDLLPALHRASLSAWARERI